MNWLLAIALPAAVADPSRPNILFILADDLGYGDLGCYGQQRIRTPNLDRLAAEGVRFTQCYAGSTVCAPSRAALMTGKHTGHVTIRGNAKVPLRPDDITVAEVLKRAGYATAAIGKWGLGDAGTTGHPNRHGFDSWFGYLDQTHAHNYYPTNLWRNETSVTLEGNLAGRKGEYAHDLFTREALDFLAQPHAQPFFLYLAYTIPHANNELGDQGMETPSEAPYAGQPWPAPERRKAAMITRLDADIGRLLSRLKELGLEQSTLVLFSSDNGPHKEGGVKPAFFGSSGPLRGVKRDLYEGGIRVPMLVRWPGHVPAGRVSDQVWAFWDFLPTAAALAQVKPPGGLDGISVLPALLAGKRQAHPTLYWEFHEGGFKQAARAGDWKAVRLGAKQPLELYDLRADAGETRNVAAQHPRTVARLGAYLGTARTASEHWPAATDGARGSPPRR